MLLCVICHTAGPAEHNSSSQMVHDNVLKHLQQCFSRLRRDTIQLLRSQLTLNCAISKHHVLNSNTRLENRFLKQCRLTTPLPHTRSLLLQTMMPEEKNSCMLNKCELHHSVKSHYPHKCALHYSVKSHYPHKYTHNQRNNETHRWR